MTVVVDILWLMFWVPFYNDKEVAKWNYGLHMFVVVLSIIEIALKAVIFMVLFNSPANMKSFKKANISGTGSGPMGP